MAAPLDPIPQEWIKDYVRTMLDIAHKFEDKAMKEAAALRAEHAMDLVKAWREIAPAYKNPWGTP